MKFLILQKRIECKHNIIYWNLEGIYWVWFMLLILIVDGIRYRNEENIEEYIENMNK